MRDQEAGDGYDYQTSGTELATLLRSPRLFSFIGWAAVVGGIMLTAYLAFTAGRPDAIGSDFGFVWLAGKMWGAGLDPYRPLFASEATRMFPLTHGWSFVHPPQWWPVARPLGTLSFRDASHIWRWFSVGCLLFSGYALWIESRQWRPPAAYLTRVLFLAALFSTEKIGAVFYLDQTGLFTLLGFALLIIGAAPGRLMCAAIGFVILMSKPSLGLPIFMMGLINASHRRGLILACIITFIACLPQFDYGIVEGYNRFLRFANNISGYNVPGSWNAPDKMNGVFHFVPHLPSLVALVLSGLVGMVLYWRLSRIHSDADAAPAFALAGIATLAAIAPIHTYDLPFAICGILLLGMLRKDAAVMMLLGVILIHSAKRFARFMVPESEALAVMQAHIDTTGGMLILASAAVTAFRGWRLPYSRAEEVEL